MPVFLLLLANEALSQGALQRPRIAHAGGQFNGATYTNSLEALDQNYEAGFRAFEIDLSFTSDGELVCLHDWGRVLPEVLICRLPLRFPSSSLNV